MASVYYKSRKEAGKKLVQELLSDSASFGPVSVVSLNTDSLLVAIEFAFAVRCPVHLYLSEQITVPGGVQVGAVNQDGQFSYGSDLGTGFSDYFYQEFHSYIDDAKRDSFSRLNRELGNKEIFRDELLRRRTVIVVIDCLDTVTGLDSFLNFTRTLSLQKIIVCAPLAMAKDLDHLRQVCDKHIVEGALDFFFGADHYFEDNSVIPREQAIDIVSKALATWPAQ